MYEYQVDSKLPKTERKQRVVADGSWESVPNLH